MFSRVKNHNPIMALAVMLIALLAPLLMMPQEGAAVDIKGSFGSGVILQDGAKPALAKFGKGNIPFVTDSANYQLGGEITGLSSDRSFDDVNEIMAIRGLVGGRAFLGNSPVFVGIGTGAWYFIDTEGEDRVATLMNLHLGVSAWGIEARVGCDALTVEGPDLYMPSLEIVIIDLN